MKVGTPLPSNKDTILNQVRTFDTLTRNDYLLKKFDSSTGTIKLYLLARENSLRPYLMKSQDPNDLDLLLLAEVLAEGNTLFWLFDDYYNTVIPLFDKQRRQIVCTMVSSNLATFKQQLAELECQDNFNLEIHQVDYKGKANLEKVLLVLQTEEQAQNLFKLLFQGKKNVRIYQNVWKYCLETVKMEDVDLFKPFVVLIESHQEKQRQILAEKNQQFLMQQQQLLLNQQLLMNFQLQLDQDHPDLLNLGVAEQPASALGDLAQQKPESSFEENRHVATFDSPYVQKKKTGIRQNEKENYYPQQKRQDYPKFRHLQRFYLQFLISEKEKTDLDEWTCNSRNDNNRKSKPTVKYFQVVKFEVVNK